MSMENTERRVNPRAKYFLVHQLDQYIPMYVFRSQAHPDSIPALITDISAGGVQILSEVDAEFGSERYVLELVGGAPGEPELHRGCEIQRVWSRQDGMYIKSGFSFGSDPDSISVLLEHFAASEHHVLRCVLIPLT